jgi:hypothetical protein
MDRLNKEQSKALEKATYLGMTPDEAKEYDARRDETLRVVEQLLEKLYG